jgi:hypothetical protein
MADSLAVVIPSRGDAVARLRAGDIANAATDTGALPGGAPNVYDNRQPALAKGLYNAHMAEISGADLLDVTDLVRMFEESESSTYTARKEAERDRDYYDNKQLTEEQIATLNKRGQPPVIINLIKRRVDFLVGLEKQQRIDPKALPRTPAHENDADAASQALRFVADSEDFDAKRSAVWRNMLLEGAGGIEVAIEEGYDGQPCIKLRHHAWDRLFWDPHSCRLDYSDASYVGSVVWMDIEDAIGMYGEDPAATEALETTLATAPSDTYDDKPRHSLWADKKRKRVRVCQIWLKRGHDWHFAEFTKGGILIAGPSPYVSDKGESECGLILQSSYCNRDNERYGAVREMISPQDDYNKRRSKSLHLLNTNQTTMEEGAVSNVEKFRQEAARPDGVKVISPGYIDKVRTETRTDLATAHFQLMQETKNEIEQMGPNSTMMGDKAQGASSASGKAIIASQQGGMIQLGDLLDGLRQFDKRVFRAMWARVRQFWNEEKWIRVTDDERNIKWVGLNVDPYQLQMQMQQNPAMAEKVAGMVPSVAELDCDIIIDEAPDSVTPALEQWQALVEIDKARGGVFPIEMLIEAAPNLKNKDRILERLKGKDDPEAAQQQAMQQQMQMRGAAAEIALKEAQAQKTMNEANQPPDVSGAAGLELQRQKHILDMEMKQRQQEMDMLFKQQNLAADIQAEREKLDAQIQIEREKAALSKDVANTRSTAHRRAKGVSVPDVDSKLTEILEKMTQSMEFTSKALVAPRRLVRDENGRPQAAEIVMPGAPEARVE